MKSKLNQIQYQSDKVKIYYDTLFKTYGEKEIDQNQKAQSFGFSQHFGETNKQIEKFVVPNILKNIYD